MISKVVCQQPQATDQLATHLTYQSNPCRTYALVVEICSYKEIRLLKIDRKHSFKHGVTNKMEVYRKKQKLLKKSINATFNFVHTSSEWNSFTPESQTKQWRLQKPFKLVLTVKGTNFFVGFLDISRMLLLMVRNQKSNFWSFVANQLVTSQFVKQKQKT